jgi:hypothetical protein
VDLDALLNRAQAAAYLKVSPNLVGMWKRNGHLAVATLDQRGNPLYRLGDLLIVEKKMRNSEQSSRNALRIA